MTSTALIEIAGVTKRYGGLRPLRISQLMVVEGDCLVLSGFDAASAEVFVNLVTGAAVPDEGDVFVAGQNTRDIATDTEWLASLDRFGMVTDRAVLLSGMSLAANLALPLTLDIDPLRPAMRARVATVAAEVGLEAGRLDAPASSLSAEERVRAHLARALGPQPGLLLLEHPTARLDPASSQAFGATLRAVAEGRRVGWLALSEDDAFARASGGRRARLNPATGALAGDGFWRRVLS